MSESIEALRAANPRTRAGFPETVEAVASSVRAGQGPARRAPVRERRRSRRRVVRGALAGAVAAAVLLAVWAAVGTTGGGPGVEQASAAVRASATLTAAAAERSGTAVVRLSHGGAPWAGSTVRWHGGDLDVVADLPQRDGRPGSHVLLVGGRLYGIDPGAGGWVDMGSPDSIDPESGTTPAETLAAVRADVGGATLRRVAGAATDLATERRADGATVYRGTVPAGAIARETGDKGGRAIRVLPFGYVAHDAAADPAAPLDVAITVDADGLLRSIEVGWGTGASAWTYAVAYRALGTSAPIAAPAHAVSLEELRHVTR